MTDPTRLFDVSGGTTNSGTTTTSTSTAQTTLTLDFDQTQCSATTSDPSNPTGLLGRTIELRAFPTLGFVFDHWQIVTTAPTADMTFGVFSEFGTTGGGGYNVIYTDPITNQQVTLARPAGRPATITTILNSPVTITAIPASGFEFDVFEAYYPDGTTSSARVINSPYTPNADGNMRSEIRIYFREINSNTTTDPLRTTTNTTQTTTGTTTTTTTTSGTTTRTFR